MNLKTLLIGLSLILTAPFNFATAQQNDKQATSNRGYTAGFTREGNTLSMACNNCSIKQKLQEVKKIVDSEHDEGYFRFVVVDMLIGNLHEFKIYIPHRTEQELKDNSRPATVELLKLPNQAELDQQVKELRDAIQGINKAVGQVGSETKS